MDSLETVIAEIDALERQLSRRGFLKLATLRRSRSNPGPHRR
jgi:hypothetical protein